MNKNIFNFYHTYETNMLMYRLVKDMISQSSYPKIFNDKLDKEILPILTNLTNITEKKQLKIFGVVDESAHLKHLTDLFESKVMLKEFNVFHYFGFPSYFKATQYLEAKGFKRVDVLTPDEVESRAKFDSHDDLSLALCEIESSLGRIAINEFLSILLGVEISQKHLVSNATSRLSLLMIHDLLDHHADNGRLKDLVVSLLHLTSKSRISLNDRKLKMDMAFRSNQDTGNIPAKFSKIQDLYLGRQNLSDSL